MKPKNHSAISERNLKAQAPSQLPASPTPCDNDNMPKGHSQFRQAVKDHQANGLKKVSGTAELGFNCTRR